MKINHKHVITSVILGILISFLYHNFYPTKYSKSIMYIPEFYSTGYITDQSMIAYFMNTTYSQKEEMPVKIVSNALGNAVHTKISGFVKSDIEEQATYFENFLRSKFDIRNMKRADNVTFIPSKIIKYDIVENKKPHAILVFILIITCYWLLVLFIKP